MMDDASAATGVTGPNFGQATGASVAGTTTTITANSTTTGIPATNNTGSGTGHNNVQLAAVTNMIIKY